MQGWPQGALRKAEPRSLAVNWVEQNIPRVPRRRKQRTRICHGGHAALAQLVLAFFSAYSIPYAHLEGHTCQSLPHLKATTVSSPVCKSFRVMVLLGFCDFKNRAVCKAKSFRSQYLRGMPSLEIWYCVPCGIFILIGPNLPRPPASLPVPAGS